MKYFKKIDDLKNPLNLLEELTKIFSMEEIIKNKQICLNDIEENSNNILRGVGSLWWDWQDNKRVAKPSRLNETDFKFLCNQFKNTVFETVYKDLEKKYRIGRVRIMMIQPKHCMSWHVDDTDRIHYPFKTQEGCFMVIENEIMHLSQNEWWYTYTKNKHTAFNSSSEDRYHLVVSVISN